MSQGEIRRWRGCLLVLGMVALLWPAGAGADELDDLKQELQEQKARSAELENRINRLESRQRLKERSLNEKLEAVEAKVDQAPEGQVIPEILEWAAKMQWSGDFRYRYEFIDDDYRSSDRHRNRIRARLGLKAQVNDEWDFSLRVASGTADPVSTNQTLDEAFSDKPIWLDRAYLDYHPAWMEGLDALAGKFGVPFYKVGKNQLIWDGDLNMEGAALQYDLPLDKQTGIYFTGGGFWVNEESSSADASLWGVQTYLRHQIEEPSYAMVGASLFCYGNVQGHDNFGSLWDDDALFGNTASISDSNAFASDYDLLEVFAEYGTEVRGMPVAVWGDWVKNTVATTSEDTGWLVGGKINKVKDPGTWEFSYDYRDIELDAVVGQFNDSDFIGGGTGGKGHRFGFAYGLAKNTQAAVTYFHNEFDGRKNDEDYDRVQVDVKLKF